MQTNVMLRFSLTLTSILGLVGAYLVDPPTTAAQDTIQDCSNWQVVTAADKCQAIADNNGITLAQLQTYVSINDRSTTLY